MIHKHANELVSDGLMDQRGGDGGTPPAAHGAKHLFIPDLFLQLFHLLLNEAAHCPVAGRAAHLVEEVLQHLIAIFGMHHFGMKLNAVYVAFFVAEGRHGAGARFGIGQHLKACGRLGNIIRMAHPTDAFFGNILKERALLQNADFPLAVFARFGMRHFSAQRIGDQLTAVADPQHGDTKGKYLCRNVRGALLVNAVGSARKNNPDGVVVPDLLHRHIAGLEVAIDVEIAHAARDQLVILSAEIEDENFFVSCHDLFFLLNVISNV